MNGTKFILIVTSSFSVVVDRRYDKNCDIGRFELAYRQASVSVPPYIGINLSVEGTGIRRPGFPNYQRCAAPPPAPAPPTESLDASGTAAAAPQISPYAIPLTHAKSSTTGRHVTSPPVKATSHTGVQSPRAPALSPYRMATSPPAARKQPEPPPTTSPAKSKSKAKEKTASTTTGAGAPVKPHIATVVDLKKPLPKGQQGVYRLDVPAVLSLSPYSTPYPRPSKAEFMPGPYLKQSPNPSKKTAPGSQKMVVRERIFSDPHLKLPQVPYANLVMDAAGAGKKPEAKMKYCSNGGASRLSIYNSGVPTAVPVHNT